MYDKLSRSKAMSAQPKAYVSRIKRIKEAKQWNRLMRETGKTPVGFKVR